jgi:hypothetical protein
MTPIPPDPEIREIDIRQALATSEKQELQIYPADQSDQWPSLPVRSRNALPSAYEAIGFGPSDWRNIILAAVAAGLGFFWTSHFFVAPEKFRPGMPRDAEYLYKRPSQISDAIWNRSAETASHKAGINTNNPTATLGPDRSREASYGDNANRSFSANPPSSSQTSGSATGSSQANRSAAGGARSASASSKATAARSLASKSARRTRTQQRRVALRGARPTGARLASHQSSASTRSSQAAPAATKGFASMAHSGLGKSTSLNMGSAAHGPGPGLGGGIHGMAARGSGGRH